MLCVCVGEMSEAAVTEPPRTDTESQTLTEPRTHAPRTHAEGLALLAEAAETLQTLQRQQTPTMIRSD